MLQRDGTWRTMTGIGIIGAGGIAEHHLGAISRHRQAKVLCLADTDLNRAQSLADKYGISRVTVDPKRILLNAEVNTIIIALPTFLHYEWLLRCARAGKDILTEKPLCRTVSEGKHVLRTCIKHNVRLAVGYMRRFSPARLKVRSLVQAGALGRPVTWQISSFGPRSDFYRGPGNWMWDRHKGGGLVPFTISTSRAGSSDNRQECSHSPPGYQMSRQRRRRHTLLSLLQTAIVLRTALHGKRVISARVSARRVSSDLREPSLWILILNSLGIVPAKKSDISSGVLTDSARQVWGLPGSSTDNWTVL